VVFTGGKSVVTLSAARGPGIRFYIWYKGMAPTPGERLGFATSTDGLTFTRFAGNPILTAPADPKGFPSGALFGPSALWDGTAFQMWFGSHLGDASGFGHAVSKPEAKP